MKRSGIPASGACWDYALLHPSLRAFRFWDWPGTGLDQQKSHPYEPECL